MTVTRKPAGRAAASAGATGASIASTPRQNKIRLLSVLLSGLLLSVVAAASMADPSPASAMPPPPPPPPQAQINQSQPAVVPATANPIQQELQQQELAKQELAKQEAAQQSLAAKANALATRSPPAVTTTTGQEPASVSTVGTPPAGSTPAGPAAAGSPAILPAVPAVPAPLPIAAVQVTGQGTGQAAANQEQIQSAASQDASVGQVPGGVQLKQTALINSEIAYAKAQLELKNAQHALDMADITFANDKQSALHPSSGHASGQNMESLTGQGFLRPVVNSVFRFGDRAYAEIMIGDARVEAEKGTRLLTGDVVEEVDPSGVHVKSMSGRKVFLPVRGSAAVTEQAYAAGRLSAASARTPSPTGSVSEATQAPVMPMSAPSQPLVPDRPPTPQQVVGAPPGTP